MSFWEAGSCVGELEWNSALFQDSELPLLQDVSTHKALENCITKQF